MAIAVLDTDIGTDIPMQPETFQCRCRDNDTEHRLHLGPDEEDQSSWCSCGRRIDDERQHAQMLAEHA